MRRARPRAPSRRARLRRSGHRSRDGAPCYGSRRLAERRADRALDLVGVDGKLRGEHVAAVARDDDVVLDADADAPPRLRLTGGIGGDVDARLDRQHHAGLEQTPCVAELRSEEHTSELQSRENLVCRLLLEKKKKIIST